MLKTAFVIGLSFFAAIVLTLIPMPNALIWFRPIWIVLVLSFWMISRPQSAGLWLAWWLGLFMDALQGSLMGEHAIALVVVAYFLLYFQRRLRTVSIWQQASFVAVMILFFQLIIFIIEGLNGLMILDWRYWTPIVTSFMLWPWLYYILHRFQRRYHLYSFP